MPQADPALRAEWEDGPGTAEENALVHLEGNGFVLTEKWTWRKPKGHVLSARDWSAIQYMCDDWDYGGLESDDAPSSHGVMHERGSR